MVSLLKLTKNQKVWLTACLIAISLLNCYQSASRWTSDYSPDSHHCRRTYIPAGESDPVSDPRSFPEPNDFFAFLKILRCPEQLVFAPIQIFFRHGPWEICWKCLKSCTLDGLLPTNSKLFSALLLFTECTFSTYSSETRPKVKKITSKRICCFSPSGENPQVTKENRRSNFSDIVW